MASYASTAASPVNLVAYLRSVASVDLDCLDVKGEIEYLGFVCDAESLCSCYGPWPV